MSVQRVLLREGPRNIHELVRWVTRIEELESPDKTLLTPDNLYRFRRALEDRGAPGGTAVTRASGHVYFILSPEQEAVKIGFSKDPRQRLRYLQTGHPRPLVLLGSLSGRTKYDETVLHRHFHHLKLSGEWFAECDELWMFMEEKGVI